VWWGRRRIGRREGGREKGGWWEGGGGGRRGGRGRMVKKGETSGRDGGRGGRKGEGMGPWPITAIRVTIQLIKNARKEFYHDEGDRSPQ